MRRSVSTAVRPGKKFRLQPTAENRQWRWWPYCLWQTVPKILWCPVGHITGAIFIGHNIYICVIILKSFEHCHCWRNLSFD